MKAETIDDVITDLSDIIEHARRRRSRLGYFPSLYRKVTLAVKKGIAQGDFDDGPRMERLDVIFANRYIEAYRRHQRGEQTTGAWAVSFRAGQDWYPLVLQHLLLGMNAHINLNLGIAAWRTSPGSELDELEGDFRRINTILSGLVDDVKTELTAVWPPLARLDLLAGNAEDRIVDFSMARARDHAWAQAQTLNALPASQVDAAVGRNDRWVRGFGQVIWKPPPAVRVPLFFIRHCEKGSVPEVIDLLD